MAKLIDERTKPWDPQMVADPVQEQLLQIIAAKKKGKRAAKPKTRARAREQRRQHHGRAAPEHRLGRESPKALTDGLPMRPLAARLCCRQRHGRTAEIRPGISCPGAPGALGYSPP